MALYFQPNNFDLNRIKSYSSNLIIGKNNLEKQKLIKDLIYHFDTKCGVKAGVVCSHSEEVDPYYSKFFPASSIFNDCAKMLRKVIERQEKLLELNERLRREGNPEKDYRILVVLDDVINDTNIKNNDLENIIYNGRSYGITLIIAGQYVDSLPPGARQNFDYIFLFNNDNNVEIKKMYESFAGAFPTENIFKTVLQEFTKNNKILVLDMTKGPNTALNDRYGIFKTNINLNYDKFGSDDFKKEI